MIKIFQTKELSKDDLKLITGTSLARKLIANRCFINFDFDFYSLSDRSRRLQRAFTKWIEDHSKGMFHPDYDDEQLTVYFERNDDMISFKLMFDGKDETELLERLSEMIDD